MKYIFKFRNLFQMHFHFFSMCSLKIKALILTQSLFWKNFSIFIFESSVFFLHNGFLLFIFSCKIFQDHFFSLKLGPLFLFRCMKASWFFSKTSKGHITLVIDFKTYTYMEACSAKTCTCKLMLKYKKNGRK